MIGRAEIEQLLPHRDPILLVDRVCGVEPDKWIVTEREVTGSEAWYHGTYPHLLLTESWAQSAGVLAGLSTKDYTLSAGLLGGMKGVEFRANVVAGDVVRHHVRLVRRLSGAALFDGYSEVRGYEVMVVGSMAMALTMALAEKDGAA